MKRGIERALEIPKCSGIQAEGRLGEKLEVQGLPVSSEGLLD
jgi:hypothetical protein